VATGLLRGETESERAVPEPEPVRRRRRDWRVALGLSLIPGLGHLYNGQLRRALFFFSATLFTIGPAVVLITAGEHLGASLLDRKQFTAFLLLSLGSVLAFLALFILGLGFWASAAVDARRSAIELSEGRPGGEARWWFLKL